MCCRRPPLHVIVGVVLVLVPAGTGSLSQEGEFRRGDSNLDGAFDLSDVIATLESLFRQNRSLECLDAADANDDGAVDISDPIAMLLHQFASAPPLPPPFATCGADPTADGLSCGRFPPCDPAASGGFVAQVVSLTVMPLEEAEVVSLDELAQENLALLGIEFDEEKREIRAPPLPLAGKWFEIDGRRRMSDRDGYIRLDALPTRSTDVPVFWQVGDTDPVFVLESLDFVPVDEQPTAALARLVFRIPPHMDRDAPGGGGGGGNNVGRGGDACGVVAIPPGCPATNATPCCEDYLGPHGDGKRYERSPTCLPVATRNFYGSKCYIWSFLKRGKPCYNEGAFPWNPDGPGCWLNHRYRNCQNMDESDFSLLPEERTLKFGERLKFEVRNNTAANSTCLRIDPRSGEGDLVLAPGAPPVSLVRDARCGGWRLDHWNDSEKRHYEEVTLEYVAPEKDSGGKCAATYTIIGEADGLVERFEVRALPKRNVWQGTCRRRQITDFLSVHNEVSSAAEVVFDLDSGSVTGTLTVEETQTDPACFHHGKNSTAITNNAVTYFEIDFTTDPPTYRGSGATDIDFTLTSVCEGITVENTVSIPDASWFDAHTSGVRYSASDDGCSCKDSVDRGVIGASHIVFEWDLTKLPDP